MMPMETAMVSAGSVSRNRGGASWMALSGTPVHDAKVSGLPLKATLRLIRGANFAELRTATKISSIRSQALLYHLEEQIVPIPGIKDKRL